MDQKPTFRPEALHDLVREEQEDPTEAKAEWRPDRTQIEQLLKEHEVKLRLPKVYYSLHDSELQAMLPYEATFEDGLIEKYEVFALADSTVQIRIYPNEFDPFWVTIDSQGVKGPEQLLKTFIKVTAQPTIPIQQYAQTSVHAVMGSDEDAVPNTNASFRITEGSDRSIAA